MVAEKVFPRYRSACIPFVVKSKNEYLRITKIMNRYTIILEAQWQ